MAHLRDKVGPCFARGDFFLEMQGSVKRSKRVLLYLSLEPLAPPSLSSPGESVPNGGRTASGLDQTLQPSAELGPAANATMRRASTTFREPLDCPHGAR